MSESIQLSVEAENSLQLTAEGSLDARLSTLKATALQILDEVESLTIAVPSNLRPGACFSEEVRQFEVSLIKAALGRTSGSQTQAARLLGLKPTTLNAKIKRYNIAPNGYQVGAERTAA
jgi:transcriptional regulator with GAF, ATPase, and Fis domain